MAEILGAVASGVTLAALFKTCIEAFDLIPTSRHQERDFKKLKLRLDIEKCRLYTWGEVMGLTNTSEADQDRPIDNVRFPDVVQEVLETVYELFHDSRQIKEKYGCRQNTSYEILDADQEGPIGHLAASFASFSIRAPHHSATTKAVQKFVWVVHDRKKFSGLVTEIKDLVDGLQNVTSPSTPVARQKAKVKRRIMNIRDAETLSAIAEACSEDYPDVADAASTRAETVSLVSTHQCQVVAWMENVPEIEGEEEDKMQDDLESLTVTELKRKVLELQKERREHQSPHAAVSLPSSFANESEERETHENYEKDKQVPHILTSGPRFPDKVSNDSLDGEPLRLQSLNDWFREWLEKLPDYLPENGPTRCNVCLQIGCIRGTRAAFLENKSEWKYDSPSPHVWPYTNQVILTHPKGNISSGI